MQGSAKVLERFYPLNLGKPNYQHLLFLNRQHAKVYYLFNLIRYLTKEHIYRYNTRIRNINLSIAYTLHVTEKKYRAYLGQKSFHNYYNSKINSKYSQSS